MSEIIKDSIKKSAVYAVFGKYYGNKLIRLIDDCCNDFCELVNNCLGISPEGDEDLFLNQQGQWTEAGGGGGNSWNLQGNAGTDPNTDFLGTTDKNPIVFKSDNTQMLLMNDADVLFTPSASLQVSHPDGVGFFTISTLNGGLTATDLTIKYDGGQFIIENGTQGAGKVLTSDAVGLATWENISTILATLPSYADDTAAAGGGLSVGDSYFSTGTSSYTRRLV